VRVRSLHDWDLEPSAAIALQSRLAARVRELPLAGLPELVAGVDCGYSGNEDLIHAAVVVGRLPGRALRRGERLEVVEEAVHSARPPRPYVPGLLSFREAPAVLECFRLLRRRPAAVIVDGQGRAHMRRLGLACHLGLFLGLPTVGCAKSVLVGEFREPGNRRGCRAKMRHRGQVVGLALRTRDGVRPVYVSVGHLVDLAGAARMVLACGAGYRLPEPVRLAHNLGTRARLAAKERRMTGGRGERSAGFILFRPGPRGRGREYLVVRDRKHGNWGFPKGHLEAGEDDLAAARREVREEAGLEGLAPVGGFRAELRYRLCSGKMKTVVFFLAGLPRAARVVPGAREIVEWAWLPLEKAVQRLSFEVAGGMLRRADARLERGA
jgi:deoxyribonuclease V